MFSRCSAGKHDFKGVNGKDLPLLTKSHGAGLGQVPFGMGMGWRRAHMGATAQWGFGSLVVPSPPGAAVVAGGCVICHLCCSPNVEAVILWLTSLYGEDGSVACLPVLLTLLLDDDPEEGVGRGQGFVVVVIIVDGQKVAVDVCVAQEHVHPRDLVHCL